MAQKREHEIDRMGGIFSYSNLTFVAAAGGNADVGLAGVHSRPRNVNQRKLLMGDEREVCAREDSATSRADRLGSTLLTELSKTLLVYYNRNAKILVVKNTSLKDRKIAVCHGLHLFARRFCHASPPSWLRATLHLHRARASASTTSSPIVLIT